MPPAVSCGIHIWKRDKSPFLSDCPSFFEFFIVIFPFLCYNNINQGQNVFDPDIKIYKYCRSN